MPPTGLAFLVCLRPKSRPAVGLEALLQPAERLHRAQDLSDARVRLPAVFDRRDELAVLVRYRLVRLQHPSRTSRNDAATKPAARGRVMSAIGFP